MQPSRGYSIHVGLNHVDPACYNGWDGALAGCINDAVDMKAIADSLGYQSTLMTDSQATSSAVISQLGNAARTLTSGDILFLSYSGHGGQMPDVNGDEDDGQDETLVLWDRQLIDDELYALWSQFATGVRIVMLSDSCHSGTVLKMLATYSSLKEELSRRKAGPSKEENDMLAALANALSLKSETTVVRATAPVLSTRSAVNGVAVLEPKWAKTIPSDVRVLVNAARAQDDATRQWIAGPSERATIQASVLLISGCQDSQLSMDGARNGLFTEKLKQVWNGGAFAGDYSRFANDIIARMPSNQQPNLAKTGALNPAFESQLPFTIQAPSANGSVLPPSPPSPPPPTGAGHQTIRRGSVGADVNYLQTRLRVWGYSIQVDGNFGPMTESAVRSFQFANALVVDGVVGPATWLALG